MGDWRCKIVSQLKHVKCPVCEKGILTVVAEVGVEAHGTAAMFQSLSAAQGRVYRCDNCGKSFVKVDNEFLELTYSKNPLVEERLEPQKKEVIEMATIVKELVRETRQTDVSLTHEELVLKRKPVTEARRSCEKPVKIRTEIKIPLESTKQSYVKKVIAKRMPVSEIRNVAEEVTTEKITED
jgi:stress response protein YsnF